MSRLAGKVVVITGGARGQGAAHGARLGAEGAVIVLTDVLDAEGEATAQALREDGVTAAYHHLDVTSAEGWAEVVAKVESEHGRLDVLVNNAGVTHLADAVAETEEGWDRSMDINAKGTFLGVRAAVPAMLRAGGGSIVNISSVYGIAAAAAYISYNASKAAVIGITKSAALAYAEQGIRVNAIAPGAVLTPMLKEEIATGKPLQVLGNTPQKRGAEPEEISAGVLFLASDEASFVTGETLVMDGGYLAR
ncbi:SDR family NAD(P)-dependent oxidoreductase [Pseudonocardia alni]|uniref:SDR family NAD(P)-dependent oxidoreductase n=1 Tax=Pseudonocardia alni TaxID=33907 RepID=UPI0033D8F3B8